MPSKKDNAKSNVERCLPKPVSTLVPGSRRKKGTYIPWDEYDEEAATLLVEESVDPENIKRPSVKIPYFLYVNIKHIITLKRQSFQQYVLSLLLQDLRKRVAQGWSMPVF